MPLGKRQRRFLLATGFIVAGLALLCFSMPLWLPWLLRPIAGKNGLHFTQYQRLGYGRFELTDVNFTNQAVSVHADHVDGLVPSVWLWRSLRNERNRAFAHVHGWHLETITAEKSPDGGSIYTSVADTAVVLKALERWLPVAVLDRGSARFQETVVNLPSITWSNGNVWAEAGLSMGAGLDWAGAGFTGTNVLGFSLRANLAKGPPFEIRVESNSLHLQSTMNVSVGANALNVQATNSWWTNHFDLTAQFARKGLLPEKATLQAPGFAFPGELVRLKEFKTIQGALSASWEDGRYLVNLDVRAKPVAVQSNLPPIQLVLQAVGDTNAATIQSATLSSPGLSAEILKPTVLYFRGPLLRERATLKLAMDVARQPWLALEGMLEGEADFTPTTERLPAARFHFAGSNLGRHDLKAKTLSVAGELNWPWVELDEIKAGFDDGSSALAKVKFELQKQTLADAHLQFTGPLIRRWLPPGWSYQGLSLSGDAAGPIKSIVHRGHLQVTNLANPELRPLQIVAEWAGEQLHFRQADVSISASNSILSGRFSGGVEDASISRATDSVAIQLEHLQLSKQGAARLELEKPVNISVNRSATNLWSGQIDSFHWSGGAGDVQVQATMDWPRSGDVRASLHNLSSDLFNDFVKASVEKFEIGKFDASAAWTNGPAVFQIDAFARMFRLPGVPVSLSNEVAAAGTVSMNLKLAGNFEGVTISNLVVNSQTSSVATARGFLPLTINPGDSADVIHLDSTRNLQLVATTQPHAFFWEQLANWTGLFLRGPNLSLGLSGTWNSPRGQLQFRAQQLIFRKAPPTTPSFDELQFALQFDQDRARLTNGQVLIQGQPVTLSGELPLDDEFWARLKQKKAPDLAKASAHLQFANAELAAFAPLFPTLLSPQGNLSLDMRLQPGGKLDGELLVHQARTRPLATLGPIRDIEVKMKLLDRTLRLENANATIGGAAVVATGSTDLHGTDWLKGTVPPFEFTLRGTNVPLSRQPESIIRSDLDLAIIKTNQEPALITGAAHLRNSYYLSDLADLVPRRVASPRRRPPYFSVEAEPLAEWRLALRVTGERFMKVRSTLFNGEVSANLTLQGTLIDPIAIGDLKINSGFVRFPFANLDVQQGFVTLTSADLYRPQLQVTAASKRFGYDVKMEVTGPVDAPVIQFTSTPPLGSEQLVLMLTAGELPKGGASLTPQEKAQTIAIFLGRDLLAKLGYGDQAEDRLTIRSGEQVSEQGSPTYNIEYKLNKRWSLVGEYDRFNDFNAGFKWRLYSK